MECALCEALVSEKYRVVYEDERVFVLVNVEPLKDGHVMVLPVRHAEGLKDLRPDEAQAFLGMIDRCMSAVTNAYGDTPMCLVNGWSYRTQPHLHAHVLPSKSSLRSLYTAAEGLPLRQKAEREALERVAERVRQCL